MTLLGLFTQGVPLIKKGKAVPRTNAPTKKPKALPSPFS